MTKKPHILCLGEILWDTLPDGRKCLGGAPANVAYHLQCHGAQAHLVSAVGNDPDGDAILQWLSHNKLSTEGIQRVAYPTGIARASLDESGSAKFDIVYPSAWDFIDPTPLAERWAAQCDAVIYGTLAQRNWTSRASLQRLLQIASQNPQCIRLLDVNIREPYVNIEWLEECLSYATVVKVNMEEVIEVGKTLRISKQIRTIFSTLFNRWPNVEYIFITKGEKGAGWHRKNKESFHMKAPKVKVADTIGAGDAFTAAVCLGLLKKDPTYIVISNAIHYATQVCTFHGAIPPK